MRTQRTRVKICGITNAEDALAAVKAGADALGVVLTDGPRQVTLEEAEAVLAAVPPFVARVGVFVDADPAFVAEAAARLQPHRRAVPRRRDARARARRRRCRSSRRSTSATASVRRRDGFEPYRGAVVGAACSTRSCAARAAAPASRSRGSRCPTLPRWAPVIVAGGLDAGERRRGRRARSSRTPSTSAPAWRSGAATRTTTRCRRSSPPCARPMRRCGR